jgi:hypothetical protein
MTTVKESEDEYVLFPFRGMYLYFEPGKKSKKKDLGIPDERLIFSFCL